jgi:outer membrane beta-barrel protein
MKRPAICFCLCISIVGWGGAGFAKSKGGGKTEAAPAAGEAASAATPADSNAAPADSNAAPADSSLAPGEPTPGGDTVTPEGTEANQLPLEPDASKGKAPTTLSWQDIVVVPRKAFIKGGRFEFAPFSGVSVNDNLIRHYAFGGSITYFLSDALSIGVEGQYYVKAFTPTEENVGLQYNRIPTLNRYLYSGALDFGYVPVYGKFAWFNKQILHWEIYATAGIGLMVTEIVPRNPGLSSFKNQLIDVPVGLGSRFFLFNWLTVNFAIKDYIFADKFEPTMRDPTWDAATTKSHADSALVNNIMLYAGIGLYLPTKFTYKTPR